MFGLFSKSSTAAVVAPPQVPRPTSMVPTVNADELTTYRETAERVGVVNGALKREIVLNELAQMGLRVFRYQDVEAYLDGLFGEGRRDAFGDRDATWGWRPLRAADVGKLQQAGDLGRKVNGQVLQRTYQLAIPLPVLLTVDRLNQAVPDLHFYVSDRVESRDKEDPFLMVAANGMSLIIERWDEPNFKG